MTTSTKKFAAAALASVALLAAGGIAAALELPDQPDPSVAKEKVSAVEAPPAEPQDNAAAHRQNENAGAPDGAGEASDADDAADVEGAGGEGERPTDTHGYEVSQLATTTEAEGQDKGEEISTLAKTNGADASDAHAQDDATHGKPAEPGQSAEAGAARGD